MAKPKIYLDEMASHSVLNGIINYGVEAVMAVNAGMRTKSDDEHLRYAADNGYVLFTLDKPFAGRTASQTDHSGLICWTGTINDIGGQVRALADFAEQHTAEDAAGHVFWLK